MSIQHIWNLSRLLGLFNCPKLANLSWKFITTTSEQGPKTTRRKEWLSLLKNIKLTRQISIKSIDFKQNLPRKFLQNWPFFTDCLSAKLALKISANLSPKIPQKFDFFHELSEACSMAWYIGSDCLKMSRTEVGINLEVTGFVYAIWHIFYDESKAR